MSIQSWSIFTVSALPLLLIKSIRSALRDQLASIYTLLLHSPLSKDPIAYLLSDLSAPIPDTQSLWNSLLARRRFRSVSASTKSQHERDVNWTSTPQEGDLIESWDRIAQWDHSCIHPHKLQLLRSVGDQHADAAIKQVNKGTKDVLCHIQQSQQDAPASHRTFWQAIDRRPPPGAGALSQDWYARQGYHIEEHEDSAFWPQYGWTASKSESPLRPWNPQAYPAFPHETQAELDVIQRGQAVFYKYAGPMLMSLLHFSLAGGFSSPRITQVLEQTAYLVPKAGAPHAPMDKKRADRTWKRLLETTQFVLDVMESRDALLPPSNTQPLGGAGWQSCIRVRLLHTAVRDRVQKMRDYDTGRNGVPVNQEDLLATLCSFSVAPLASLQRMGIRPTQQEREDYIALWRHIGFYMGVEPSLLRSCFKDPKTADRTLWCTILHLFSETEVSKTRSPTIPVLTACSDRPPFHTPLEAHFAIARHLLGPSLSDSLGIPKTSAWRTFLTDVAFFGMHFPIWFGGWYRSGWEAKRQSLARPLLRRLMTWSAGDTRPRFEMPSQTNVGDTVNTESDKDIPVVVDTEANLALVRQWRWLMREMMAVSAAACLVPFVAVYCLRYTHSTVQSITV